jgi:PhnB protein
MATQLVPYIFFYGRCAEALEFYKSIFGGSYEAMRVGDTPMASEMGGSKDRIMHASFTAGAIVFQASDGRDDKSVNPDEGNISLSLTLDDAAQGEKIFHALGAGGNVGMPIDKAFWGGRFGMVTDKFGTEWMVSLP